MNIRRFTIRLTATVILMATLVQLSVAQELRFALNPKEPDYQGPKHLNYTLKPTQSREDVLTLVNYSDKESYHLRIYAVDATQSTEGVVGFKKSEAEQNHIGQWVKFNQNDLELSPKQTSLLSYQINIPEKTTPGLYQGALVAELVSKKNGNSSQIQVVSRVIEPIYITVPGRKSIKYSLDDFSYQEINGQPTFKVKISNQSNILLKTELNLKIEGTLLKEPYILSLNHPTILQGDNFEKTFKLPNPPLLGSYQATLVTKVYEYDVAQEQLKELDTITKQISFSIIPYQCIAVLLILIILILIAEYFRRKYFREKKGETFLHIVKRGETIISIGETYQLNWKMVAKLNKLSKPYIIRPGQELILPFPTPKKRPHHIKKHRLHS